MRLNSELKLRKLGSHYMIVDSCAGRANIANVYVLNATAAWLWEQVEQKDARLQRDGYKAYLESQKKG